MLQHSHLRRTHLLKHRHVGVRIAYLLGGGGFLFAISTPEGLEKAPYHGSCDCHQLRNMLKSISSHGMCSSAPMPA